MTDSEIIKALECCTGGLDYCKECPAKEYNVECGDVLKNNVLKLINRQKAEIERLQKTQSGIDNFARELCKERMLKGKAIADFEDLQEYIRKEAASAPFIEQRMKQISDDELIELVYDIIESYEAMKSLCLDCSREEISALIAEAVLAANAGKY